MPSAARFVLKDSHPAIQDVVLQKSAAAAGTTSLPSSPSSSPRRGFFSLGAGGGGGRKHSSSTTIPTSNLTCDVEGDPASNEGTINTDTVNASSSIANNQLGIQGRSYNTERSIQPGGVKLEEMTAGMKYACMSITDDKPNTLRNIGIANPWQVQGVRLILQDCGCPESILDEEVHKPLSCLLPKYIDNLTVDHIFDETGWKGLHVLDTQGYIAHNDTTIVLAYRCTTSGKDWLTNFATTASAWETEDFDQGHSGHFSGLKIDGSQALQVHTGFYNNFIASVPAIRQYIHPLLADTTKPKKFYIAGHSLGGGIAHMALCYFLLENQDLYNWHSSPHKLIWVTAGSPRAYTKSMQTKIDERLAELTDKVVAYRLVRDKDVVSTVPPTNLGFAHCTKRFVYITKDDAILINPNLKNVVHKKTMTSLLQRHPSLRAGCTLGSNYHNEIENDDNDDASIDNDCNNTNDQEQGNNDASRDMNTNTAEETSNTQEQGNENTKNESYEKTIRMVPRPLRDHMPEFYLKPLMSLLRKERKYGFISLGVNQRLDDAEISASRTQIAYDVNPQNGEETFDLVWNDDGITVDTTESESNNNKKCNEGRRRLDNVQGVIREEKRDDVKDETGCHHRSGCFQGLLCSSKKASASEGVVIEEIKSQYSV